LCRLSESVTPALEAAFGIDLGTTYSSIGFLTNQMHVEFVSENQSSTYSIPTFVQYRPDTDEWVYGGAASDTRSKYPMTTFYDLKRLIGQQFSNLSSAMLNCSFSIIEGPNDSVVIQYTAASSRVVQVRPRTLYAKFLRWLVESANEMCPVPHYEAVITIPANFSNNQRKETLAAAQEAGLSVLRLLHEPTSAARSVIHFRQCVVPSLGLVLIYDFGGGTLDVSLLDANFVHQMGGSSLSGQ
jgi:molecular chaperone DnaK (HSP70)